MAETEIIFVLDSPGATRELVHFLSGLHQLYALPLTILIMSANFGYAAANNAGRLRGAGKVPAAPQFRRRAGRAGLVA